MRVYCTRHGNPNDRLPHINEIDEEELLKRQTLEQYTCQICGMPLILARQYVVEKELGRGGMGKTFLAIDLHATGKTLNAKKRRVLKQFHPAHAYSEANWQRLRDLFQREAETLEELNHPQIPRFFALLDIDACPDLRRDSTASPIDRFFYLVQEYVEGQDLERERERRFEQGEVYTENDIRRLLGELLEILRFVHSRNYIHRDIKPSNIIRSSRDRKLYLIDFGAVKDVIPTVEGDLPEGATRITSVGFSPPEFPRGDVYYSSDLYSLAATCVWLLIHPPKLNILETLIATGNWRNLANISDSLKDILTRMLQNHPDDRFPFVQDVIQALASSPHPSGIASGTPPEILPGVPASVSSDVSPDGLPGVSSGVPANGSPDVPSSSALEVSPSIASTTPPAIPFTVPAAVISPATVSPATTPPTPPLPLLESTPPSAVSVPEQRQQRRTVDRRVIGLAIVAIAAIAGIFWWLRPQPQPANPASGSAAPSTSSAAPISNLNQRFSQGNQLLIQRADDKALANKQAGSQAFATGDYQTAIEQFTNARTLNPYDPETLIYLNNAKVAAQNPIQIAVSVPIGTQIDVASEILRGVAQAQDEANQNLNPDGKQLRGISVTIVSDNNDQATANAVAEKLVQEPDILAVVGHNASDASLAAAQIYKDRLVMITPTSLAERLSNLNYIFRAVPQPDTMPNQLAKYARRIGKSKLLVCYNPKAQDNYEFQKIFLEVFQRRGGEKLSIDCDFAKPNLNPDEIIRTAVQQGADSLLIAPHVNDVGKDAVANLLIANQKQGNPLALFGSVTLYTNVVIEKAGTAAVGLVLSAPWESEMSAAQPFRQRAKEEWAQAEVNWRTAFGYDATIAIIQALQQLQLGGNAQPTRSQLNTQLREMVIRNGALGDFQFNPQSGDRPGNPTLVRVVEQNGKPKLQSFSE